MNGQGFPQHSDRAIAALAERQHGVVAHRQLLALGLNEDAVDYRLLVGRLHAVHRGIYAVGHRNLTKAGRWMAAVSACGPTAVLSHRDAAALWLIRRDSRSLIEVTAPGRSRHARPGIVVHRPRRFEPDERTEIDGIPVTTVARTLLDLAGTLSLERLTRAWDESVRLGVFDLADLERVRGRFKRRRGIHKIDALIAQARPVPPESRSDLERRGFELFRDAADIPTPAVNLWILDMEVDLVWTKEKLVVELDHEEWHAKTRIQRERDNARDVKLQVAGYRVLRVSGFRLDTDPTGIVQDVRDLLAASAATAA